MKFKDITEAVKSPAWYTGLWRAQKGVFYRGHSTKTGKSGAGLGALGTGIYLTWREPTAAAYARLAKDGVVEKFKVPSRLKLADSKGGDVIDIKKKMGIDGYSADPMYAKALTFELKQLGYDGVISDSDVEGLVIFNERKVKKIK